MPVADRTPFFTAKVAFCAPFGMLTRRQTGEVDLENQEAFSCIGVSWGLAFASIDLTGRRASRLHTAIGETIEGISHGGLLGQVL